MPQWKETFKNKMIKNSNYLRDGIKISEENTNIFVRKSGFEARIYSFAHNYSAFYGVFAIILAILAGYLAALSFRKI